MAKYYPVWPKYWRGDRRRWDDRQKLLGLYLLTCEHRNLEGLYFLPKAYIASDLSWTPIVVDRTLEFVVKSGFCFYDETAEVVLVPRALAHQAPKTARQITGALRSLAAVPDTSLWDEFVKACESHAPDLSNAIANGITNGIADPSESDGESHSNIARTHTSTSTSSSTSEPPGPRPAGGRKRDRDAWEEKASAFAASVLPGIDPRQALMELGMVWMRIGYDATRDEIVEWLRQHKPHLLADDTGQEAA